MFRCIGVALLTMSALLLIRPVGAQDWSWRGPTGDGHAAPDQKPPTEWSAETNVVWKTEVPGRGHASPVVVAGKILLATADEEAETQSVVCFDFATGEQLWITECNQGGFLPEIHPKNTHASHTIATDGQHVFAVFTHRQGVHVYALDLDGKKLWDRKLGPFAPAQYQFGSGQSPIFFNGQLIVTSETEAMPTIQALDPSSGETAWKIDRPKACNYGTPVVTEINGKPVLLISGGKEVAAYDANSGQRLWREGAAWLVACGTMVWNSDKSLVFASGGFPANQTMALRTDGSGVAWENNIKCYEQSMIVVDDCLYGFNEGGVLFCWDANDGRELWKSRLRGPESASPVFAGGHLYIMNEKGKTWVIQPDRSECKLVAINELGNETFASAAAINNQLLMRVADDSSGARQEYLYCLGMTETSSR